MLVTDTCEDILGHAEQERAVCKLHTTVRAPYGIETVAPTHVTDVVGVSAGTNADPLERSAVARREPIAFMVARVEARRNCRVVIDVVVVRDRQRAMIGVIGVEAGIVAEGRKLIVPVGLEFRAGADKVVFIVVVALPEIDGRDRQILVDALPTQGAIEIVEAQTLVVPRA